MDFPDWVSIAVVTQGNKFITFANGPGGINSAWLEVTAALKLKPPWDRVPLR